MGQSDLGNLSLYELSLIEQQCGFGFWSHDLLTGDFFWSDGLFALLDVERGEVEPGADLLFSLLHPEDRPRAEHRWSNLEDHGISVLELRLVTPRGAVRRVRSHIRVVFENWQPVRVVGAMIEIAELHQFRVSASEGERRYLDLLRSVSPIMWAVLPDGAVTSCANFCAYTGMSPHDAQGWGWLGRVHEKYRSSLHASWIRAVQFGEGFAMTVLVQSRHEEWSLSTFRVAPIADRLREVRPVAYVCVDIQRSEWTFFPERANGNADVDEDGAGEPIVTGAIIRAARGLLDWPAKTLAHKSGVSLSTIRRMEANGIEAHRDLTANMIQRAFERAGVAFLSLPDGSIAVKLTDSP